MMDLTAKQTSLNKPDKSLQSFIILTSVITALLLLFLFTIFTVRFSLVKFNTGIIELIIFLLVAAFIVFFIITASSVAYLYLSRSTNAFILLCAKAGLYILMPFIMGLSEFVRFYKDPIRIFYINLNNIVVKSAISKLSARKTLILLPHCLQNSNCNIRITHDIENCTKCMKCSIGQIKELIEGNPSLSVAVATGGSAARNMVLKIKPELIIAVACERDLASGISDVKSIPVMGVLNKRPNGPCVDTTVEIEEIRKAILNYCKIKT